MLCLSPATAHAETLKEFTQRVENAYQSRNPKAALWDLFYTGGLDKTSYNLLLETIDKMTMVQPPLNILTEPLGPRETAVERADGYVYFQNIEPVGALNITQRSRSRYIIRQYYAKRDGRFYLTATIRKQDDLWQRIVPEDNWFFKRDRGQSVLPKTITPAEGAH